VVEAQGGLVQLTGGGVGGLPVEPDQRLVLVGNGAGFGGGVVGGFRAGGSLRGAARSRGALRRGGAAAGGQAQRHGGRQGQCKCFSHRVLSFGVKNAGLSRPAPPDTFMLPENRGKNKVKFHRK